MPDEPDPRGKHPEDDRLFGPEAIAVLRRAAEEATWLVGRGYPAESAQRFVADHHQLEARQRLGLRRGTSSDAQYRRNVARELEPDDVARRPLAIDGFNVIVTVEVALAGGPIFKTVEGVVRDIAGVRGSYHVSELTEQALERIGKAFASLKPSKVRFYLDQPVSNSGRLRERIVEHATRWKCGVEVDIVPDPDRVLKTASRVATTDSAILEECASWFNLAGWVVERIPQAWVLSLQC